MKHVLHSAALLGALWALPVLVAQAQPGSGGPAPTAGPTTTPIDGGVSLLLASGVAYGLRRLKQRRQKQPPTTG